MTVTEVRINRIELGKPGKSQKGNNPGQTTVAWQIVDADTRHSMAAGFWISRDLAVECCKRKRWSVRADEQAA